MIREKGKRKIWVYNAGVDREWQEKSCGVRKVKDKNEQELFNSQAELVLFLAGANDVVFLTKQPEEEFLKDMGQFGCERAHVELVTGMEMPISQMLLEHPKVLDNIKEKDSYLYVPYILSEYDEEICRRENLTLYGSSADIVRIINNKMEARKIVEGIGLPVAAGYLCSNRTKLTEARDRLNAIGCEKFAIKEPYNSAGKGVYFIRDDKQFQAFARMMRFPQDGSFEVVIEEWYENKRDINYQIEIDPDGNVELLALTEQIIEVTSYKGTIYPVQLTAYQREQYEEYAQKIGKELYRRGFTGLVGIDSMIKEDGVILPAIEFNARLNQSTFYLPVLEFMEKKNRKTLIRGYDVQTERKLTYSVLKELLKKQDLYYSNESHEGVVILNAAGLSVHRDSKYHSRMLLGIAFDKEKTLEDQYGLLEDFVKYIQTI